MHSSENASPFLPHGGYRRLRSYKVAEVVYDATVVFCRRFFSHDRRMTEQMVQAARSGVRNISEGSGAAATSRKTEMKLTNVAHSSLSDELLRDYESFLRQNGLRVWPKDSREAKAMRARLAQDLVPNSSASARWSSAAPRSFWVVRVCGEGRAGNCRQRNDLRGPPGRVFTEASTPEPRPEFCRRWRIYREALCHAQKGTIVRQVRPVRLV